MPVDFLTPAQRERYGRHPNIVSTEELAQMQARCCASGANAFIPKPIEQDLLLRTIARLMDLTWIYKVSNGRSSDTVALEGRPQI
jgi:CheY-like chemotaxis protein